MNVTGIQKPTFQVSQASYFSKLACNQASSGWACLPGKFSRLQRFQQVLRHAQVGHTKGNMI